MRAATTFAGAVLGLLASVISFGASAADDWRSVEADNGAVYKVNMGTAEEAMQGGVQVFMYADEGLPIEQVQQQFVYFDCKGHMQPMQGRPIFLPPRSIGAKISALVCRGHRASGDPLN